MFYLKNRSLLTFETHVSPEVYIFVVQGMNVALSSGQCVLQIEKRKA